MTYMGEAAFYEKNLGQWLASNGWITFWWIIYIYLVGEIFSRSKFEV